MPAAEPRQPRHNSFFLSFFPLSLLSSRLAVLILLTIVHVRDDKLVLDDKLWARLDSSHVLGPEKVGLDVLCPVAKAPADDRRGADHKTIGRKAEPDPAVGRGNTAEAELRLSDTPEELVPAGQVELAVVSVQCNDHD